ncbi:MAG: PEP-CTERM sorting domain-containing protein [Planctomycetota bacterium]
MFNATFLGARSLYVWRFAGLLAVLLARSSPTRAEPAFSVRNGGANGGNQRWVVEVSPDANLFSETDDGQGGSLAVELTFEIVGTALVSASANATDWPNENPGSNPFTSDVTEGVQVDLINNPVFASLGSALLTSETALEVLTIETAGTVTGTLDWGGQTVLGGTSDAYTASIIAQSGTNFGPYVGSLTLGSDADLNGLVDGNDFLLLQRNDLVQLPAWEADFAAADSAAVGVPEPASSGLIVASLVLLALATRRRRLHPSTIAH